MKMNPKLLVASFTLLFTGTAFAGSPPDEVVLDLPFPTFGFFETFFASGNTELDGYTVTDAELFLEVEILTGNAANVQFFMLFPIDTDPSTEVIDDFGVFTTGELLGWSGTGTFSETFDVSGAIGAGFVADVIYVGGIFGEFGSIGGPPGDTGFVTDNSVFQLTLVPCPSSAAMMGLVVPFILRRRRRK